MVYVVCCLLGVVASCVLFVLCCVLLCVVVFLLFCSFARVSFVVCLSCGVLVVVRWLFFVGV